MTNSLDAEQTQALYDKYVGARISEREKVERVCYPEEFNTDGSRIGVKKQEEPVDADGVPIKVGDRLVFDDGRTGECVGFENGMACLRVRLNLDRRHGGYRLVAATDHWRHDYIDPPQPERVEPLKPTHVFERLEAYARELLAEQVALGGQNDENALQAIRDALHAEIHRVGQNALTIDRHMQRLGNLGRSSLTPSDAGPYTGDFIFTYTSGWILVDVG